MSMKAETTGYSMKIGMVGLLEHMPGDIRELHLFTMSEDMETGANHVVEVMHRWLQRKQTHISRLSETIMRIGAARKCSKPPVL